jgi:hypothetical protein
VRDSIKAGNSDAADGSSRKSLYQKIGKRIRQARLMAPESNSRDPSLRLGRSAGSQFATPWHQDEPCSSVAGYDTCTLWMPLVPLRRENVLACVPGPHRLDSVFYQYNFGELNPEGKSDVDQVDFAAVAEQEFPVIDAGPQKFGVVSWDMQPGGCVAFNSRLMHGGSGKLDEDRELRVFTTKWLGRKNRCGCRGQILPDAGDRVARPRCMPCGASHANRGSALSLVKQLDA